MTGDQMKLREDPRGKEPREDSGDQMKTGGQLMTEDQIYDLTTLMTGDQIDDLATMMTGNKMKPRPKPPPHLFQKASESLKSNSSSA